MKIRGGHRFWFNQPDMLRHAENAQIFIKYADTEFTSFDNFALFLNWFENYRKYCAAAKIPFTILEILRTGTDMCFACDIEIYCPLEIADSTFHKVAYTLRQKFREVYGKYADANNVVFLEDHRPCATKLEKSDTEKTPMKKMSFHALGLSEIFNEMHTTCEMQQLAKLVNKGLLAEMAALTERHQIFLPNGNILDMKIYTRNRALRTVLAQKNLGSRGLQLSDCSKHVSIQNCFVTRVLCDTEKTYYKIPTEFRVTGEDSVKHVLKRMPPIRHRTAEMTLGKMETELNIKRYLTDIFGDDVTVKYNGISGSRDSFEVRGHRHCPECDEEHVHNCAYVNDVGGGNFSYNCRASTTKKRNCNIDMSIFKGVREQDAPAYLESFAHIKKKVISICGPMGCGKTYRIKEFIQLFPKGTRILFITCRKGMAASLSGRFEGFDVYTDKTNQTQQIQEYESLHRITTSYDIVILDEVRSMLASAACFETNGLNLTTNMEKLKDLCEDAQHVICADADLHIDGCVAALYKHLFNEEDIHHINHTSGGQKLHHIFADEGRFVQVLEYLLKSGKKIMLCCGSSKELKALREIALKIIPDSQIGIYYANSPKQHELRDVKKFWPNYNLIGFTSTITVSIDFTDPVDFVMISPCHTTCGQRDMCQMKSRARNIVENMVVVKYDAKIDGPLIPLDVDLEALQNQEMNMVINRRRVMTSFMNAYDREFYGTISKVGAGHKAKYFTNVLTDVWVWHRVEEYLKRRYWMRYFLNILEGKGYTWSAEVRRAEGYSNEDPTRFVRAMKEEKAKVSIEAFDALEKADVSKMGAEEYKELMMRKIRGTATEEDLAMIQKYQVQIHYKQTVGAQFVMEFDRKKRAIYNQTLIKRFPATVRSRMHSNTMHMKDSLDTVSADPKLIGEFQKTLRLMGFESAADPNTRMEMESISEEALESMKNMVELAKTVSNGRKPQGKKLLSHFNLYLEQVMGYKLKWHRVKQKGKPPSAYTLQNRVPEAFTENKLYSDDWFQDYCARVDKFMNVDVGTEIRFMANHMDIAGEKRVRKDAQVISFWGGPVPRTETPTPSPHPAPDRLQMSLQDFFAP